MCSRAPWLHGRYPASQLLRTQPPPSRLRPISRGHRLYDLPTLLRRFLDGTRTASPVARHVLVTVLPLPPRQSDLPPQSDCDKPCCLRPDEEGSTSGVYFLTRQPVGSLALRPGDSLTIPRMALSIGSISFVSSTDAIQATGLLALAPVGLTPTEHASLGWTHCLPKTCAPCSH